MPLIDCPECGRQISTQAEACPQCGHPNRAGFQPAKGPQCYACLAPATTRCQSCGALSCVQHVQNIFVSRGHGGGAYELRCQSCYSSAQVWQVIGWVIMAFILCIVGMVVLGWMQ